MTSRKESLPPSGGEENSAPTGPKKKSFVRITPSRKKAPAANSAKKETTPKVEVIEPEVIEDEGRPGRGVEKRNRRTEVIDLDKGQSASVRARAGDSLEDEYDSDDEDNRDLPVPVEGEFGPPPHLDDSEFDDGSDALAPTGKESDEKGLVVSSALQRYLAELRKYPLMTLEEERATALRAHEQNDLEARGRLITANLRLVVKIAMEYRRAYSQILDLIQEGNAGLVQAVNRFNPYRGVKLSTYSAWWIRAYILKFLMDNKSLVRMGTTDAQRKLFFRLRSEAEKMYALTQRFDAHLLAESIGVKESDVVEMQQRLTKHDVSLDAPLGEDSDTRQVDALATNIEEPDARLEREEIISLLQKQVSEVEKELNERDAFIFHNRIMAEEPVTLQDVGDKFGITRERARQLEARVLKKIKERLLAAGIEK